MKRERQGKEMEGMELKKERGGEEIKQTTHI